MTELCYGTDLVILMLLQAQAEAKGAAGLGAAEMAYFRATQPRGYAIEVRVYAENPAADYKPAPGLFTDVHFPEGKRIRVDTWLERGSLVTPHFGNGTCELTPRQVNELTCDRPIACQDHGT